MDSREWSQARHELFYFKRQSRTLEDIGLFRANVFTVRGDGGEHQAERVPTAMVSASVFGVLGIAPEAGRLLNPDDNRREPFAVALIGHDYWARRFGSDPAIVGKTIDVEGFPVVIVGILPS